MIQLTTKMKASTMVEVLVASVIFLAVFAISLETVTRLAVRRDDGMLYVVVNNEIARLFREYSYAGERLPGTTAKEYDWGTIVITVAPYRNYNRLQVIDVTATIRADRKVISKRRIIAL